MDCVILMQPIIILKEMISMTKHKWRLVILVVFLLAALHSGLTAKAASRRAVDDRVEQVLKANKVNGIVLVDGTAKHPHVISNRVVSNQQQVVKPTRLIPIASFQKLMTGIAVEDLVMAGKLSLATPLVKYLPQVGNADQVTVEKLMMHTSGLVNSTTPLQRPLRGEKAQLKYSLNGCRSNGKFSWHYADLDYVLLAKVIHQASHQSYRRYLLTRVVRPAGIKLKFYDQVKKDQVTLAIGKQRTWKKLQLAMSTELGAGDVLCTPVDYWRFYHQVLLDNPDLLKQFLAKKNPTGAETYFGGTYIEAPYLHANGYLAGYSCSFYSNYESKRTLMFFANNVSYKKLRTLNSQLHHAYFGDYLEEQATINGN